MILSSIFNPTLEFNFTLPTADRSYLSDLNSLIFFDCTQKPGGLLPLAETAKITKLQSFFVSITQPPALSIDSLEYLAMTVDFIDGSNLHSISSSINVAGAKNKSKNNFSEVSSVGGSPGLIIL